MKKAVIQIPENGDNIDLQTNGVNTLQIISSCQALSGLLSRQIVEQAIKEVGNNPKSIEKYIDSLILQSGVNIKKDNLGLQ